MYTLLSEHSQSRICENRRTLLSRASFVAPAGFGIKAVVPHSPCMPGSQCCRHVSSRAMPDMEVAVVAYPRLFFNMAGFPPTKMKDRTAVTKHKTATTRFIFPYPIASLRAPDISGPTVSPALNTIEFIP